MVGVAAGPGVHFPDGETLRAALDLAIRAPSAHNSQPWRWRVDDGALHLRAEQQTPSRTGPQRRDVLLSCGAALHHCTVALAAVGWHARIRRLPDAGDPDLLARVELDAQPPGDLDLVLCEAIPHRRSDRRRLADDAVRWGDVAILGARAARAGVMLRVIDDFPPLPDMQAGPAGLVVTLGTQDDDDLAALRAGEVTSLVLLSATSMGLASCAVTQPLVTPATRRMLRADVFGDSAHPQIMVRMGWAALDAGPLPMTPRRPLPEVARIPQIVPGRA